MSHICKDCNVKIKTERLGKKFTIYRCPSCKYEEIGNGKPEYDDVRIEREFAYRDACY